MLFILRQSCKISNKYFQVEQRPIPPSHDSSVREEGLRVKRGKSEEIVLNKHKASNSRQTPSPKNSVAERPASAVAGGYYRGYYSGCAIHSRPPSEMGLEIDQRPR